MAKEFLTAWDKVELSDQADRRIRAALEQALPENNVIDLHAKEAIPVKRKTRRISTAALIAAALAVVLSVTAYAVGEYTGFFETVFGGEDAGKQTYDLPVDSWDEDGSQKTMEIVTEGQPVDQDMAQRVLDGSVSAAGASITVGDYICTVEDIAMADNGIGVMTYTIESGKGFPALEVTDETWGIFYLGGGGTWLAAGDGESWVHDTPQVFPAGQDIKDGPGMDVMCSLVSQTDTKLTVAAYMASFGEAFTADALDVYFFWGDKGDYSADYRLTIPLAEPADMVELTGPDGWTASVSAMGLTVAPPEGDPYGSDYGFGDVVIHYADGSEYVVEAGEPYTVNMRLSCITDGGLLRYVFNRLIDPEQVTSVTAVGSGHGFQDENGQPVAYEDAWVKVKSVLIGDTWTSDTELREGLTDLDVDLDLTFEP